MLDKIQNITPSGSFEGGSKNPYGLFRRGNVKQNISKDIVSISETAKFIAALKWKLNSLQLISSNILELCFQFGELSIIFAINSDNFLNEPRFQFQAIKEILEYESQKKAIIFAFKKKKYVKLNEIKEFNFSSLDKIFQKALKLNMLDINHELADYEQKELIKDLILKLESDFEYFFNRFCEFVNLLGFMQIPDKYEFPDDNLEPFLIQKIIANL